MIIRLRYSLRPHPLAGVFILCWLILTSLPTRAQITQLTKYPNIPVNQEYFGFAKMSATPDGGFAVLQVHPQLGDIHILRFDHCGDLQWARIVTMNLLYRPTRSSDLIITPDGILHAGIMHHGQPGYFTLLRFSVSGEFMTHHSWRYHRMGGGVFSMGLMPDGQIFLTGINHPPMGPTDFTTLIDSAGNLGPVFGYMQSTIGYQTVGASTPDGKILLRRGDQFSLVDPYKGEVIWRQGLVAPLYNGVIPTRIPGGWMLLGQFANSLDKRNAVPVFVGDDGEFISLGEMFPANGNSNQWTENIQMRRVLRVSDNRLVTVTTDSIERGFISVVVLSDMGEVIEQRHFNPDPDQYRLLNHDFALLPGEKLAIAANLDSSLAIVQVSLADMTACGTVIRKDVLPYQTSVSHWGQFSFRMDTLQWEPFDIETYVNDVSLNAHVLCRDVETPIADTVTILPLCPDDSVRADATHPKADAYRWSNGDTTSRRTFSLTGEYTVEVQTGCQTFLHTFRISKAPDCDCPPRFPNLFTPNADGTNDDFGPVDACPYPDYRLTVFNRWGHVVFASSRPDTRWDGTLLGKEQPSDTYLWLLEYRPMPDSTDRQTRGEVTLLR